MVYQTFVQSLGDNHPLKAFTADKCNKVRTVFIKELDNAFTLLSKDSLNNDWFNEKLASLKNDITRENVSSILGEFRAYSIIKNSFFGDNLICNKYDGADFITKTRRTGTTILIEVNTPLGRSQENRTILSHKQKINGNIITHIKEIAPFGFPKRKKDNIQCEAISKIAAIKGDEKQFKDDAINILFIDFVNPFFNDYLDILNDHHKPYLFFQNQITWGAIWHAFYAKQDDKIFDHMNNLRHSSSYTMEFNGRFHNSTKINFALVNMINNLAIFEGFRDIIDKAIYPMLFSFNKINFDDIWINWPVENLRNRINDTRQVGFEFDKLYYI